MNTYYTIEEKYLKAIEKLDYGQTPKSLKLLDEILADEPLFVRAHFQIGMLYYYQLLDYKAAGYHFKLCTEIEPSFPNVYYHYISLLVFLNMESSVNKIGLRALAIPGVDSTDIYELMALCCENNRKWNQAMEHYQQALMQVTSKQQKNKLEESIERINFKIDKSKAYIYQLAE